MGIATTDAAACAALLSILVACGDAPGAAGREGPENSRPHLPITTLISTSSGVLGRPADLEFAGDGTLLVLDDLSSRIHRVDMVGRYLGGFSGEGSGPAELSRPTTLARGNGDTLWVVDSGNGRLQAFTTDGMHLETRPAHPWVAYPSHVTRQGALIASPSGQDSALAVVFDVAGQRRWGLGSAPVPFGPGGSIRMTELATEIAEGRVPVVFRNTAFPAVAPDGSVWLSRPVDGAIEFYDLAAGTGPRLVPTATHALNEPEFSHIRDHWLAENRAPESDGVSVLLLVRDLYATEHDAWVLLNQPPDEFAVVLRLSETGEYLGRWILDGVVGASTLAVDRNSGSLVLGIADLAAVVSVPIPGQGTAD